MPRCGLVQSTTSARLRSRWVAAWSASVPRDSCATTVGIMGLEEVGNRFGKPCPTVRYSGAWANETGRFPGTDERLRSCKRCRRTSEALSPWQGPRRRTLPSPILFPHRFKRSRRLCVCGEVIIAARVLPASAKFLVEAGEPCVDVLRQRGRANRYQHVGQLLQCVSSPI